MDKYFFLIGCPIAFLASLFTIITFFKYKKSRKQPGDIILAISTAEATLAIHWFSSAVYALYNDGKSPYSGSSACTTEAVFSSLAGAAEFTYNGLFCVYIIFLIRNNLKGTTIPQRSLHLVASIIIIGFFIYIFFIDKSDGLSLFGTCSFR